MLAQPVEVLENPPDVLGAGFRGVGLELVGRLDGPPPLDPAVADVLLGLAPIPTGRLDDGRVVELLTPVRL